ncbi:MAG: hypothetical protein ABIH23_28345, partial [bacterium]
ADPSFAVGFLQDVVLGAKVLNEILLLPVDEAGQDGEEKVPGLKDEFHRGPDPSRQREEHRAQESFRHRLELVPGVEP